MRALLAGLALAMLLAPSAALAADTTVTRLSAPTAMRSYAGWAAWLRLDRQTSRYVLQVRSPDGKVTTRSESAAVPDLLNPDSRALAFDLGPDAAGKPAIAVAACASGSCGVEVGRLPAGPTARVPGTATTTPASAVALWRSQVVFVTDNDDVWLARDGARRALSPWPSRLCTETLHGRTCAHPARRIGELDLRKNLMASVLRFYIEGQGGFATVRLGAFNVTTGRRTTEGEVIPGLGGQTFLAPTFVDGRTLTWLLTCTADSGGCSRRFGVYRRDLRTGRVQFAVDRTQREGWAPLDRTTALLGPGRDVCGDDASARCAIVQRRLRFRTVSARRG